MGNDTTDQGVHSRIVPSQLAQLADFRAYWQAAVEYQKRHGYPSNSAFPEALLRAEIGKGTHFSGMRADGVCTGYLSVTLEDPAIWGEREHGDAIYIHRMVANPAVRGGALTRDVLAWAKEHARSLGRRYVRMDTWAVNRRLVDYYVSCGYRHIGEQAIGKDPRLLPHYHGITLALFENPV